jgi:hypothetical protein
VANRFLAAIELVLDAARAGSFRVGLIGGFALPFHGVMRATADVDFLVEASGADRLHEALLAAGERCLNRTDELANYDSTTPEIAPVDVLYARRPPSLAMLERARASRPSAADVEVPVVDAEGLIGLKLQAMVNHPGRRDRERDDIRELLIQKGPGLDLELVRGYYRAFELEAELEGILSEIRRG